MISGTMPLINGEGSTVCFTGSRRMPLSGTTIRAMTAINSNDTIPATRNPRRCSGDKASSFSSLLPCHLPRRGSTILSVISPPTIVSTITELAIKYQLSITLTCIAASRVLAASVLIPESSTSVVTISRLAVKPQPTPAIAASKPATG